MDQLSFKPYRIPLIEVTEIGNSRTRCATAVMVMHRWTVRYSDESFKDWPSQQTRRSATNRVSAWVTCPSTPATSTSPSLICRRPSNLYRISFGLTRGQRDAKSRESTVLSMDNNRVSPRPVGLDQSTPIIARPRSAAAVDGSEWISKFYASYPDNPSSALAATTDRNLTSPARRRPR